MADIILLTVIRKAVEIAGNLAVEEGSRFSRLETNINWIEREMRYIQSYLEDVESKQVANKRVATLMSDIRGLGLDVEDILDKYSIEIASQKRKGFFGRLRSGSGIFSYPYKACNFVAEIEGIKEKVNDINCRRQNYGIQEKNSNDEEGTWDARQTFPHLDEPIIVGFEEHIKNLVARLLDKNTQCRVVSITGMAGLGKTTLAKKVYNSCRQNFECSAWICISQQPNMPELLRDIARRVGLEKEKWEHDVEANLHAFLRHKRYVIVIDDIWEIKPWEALKTVIPYNFGSGGRIVLTSRNRDVGLHIGGQSSLFELQPLDPKNSQNLFFRMIRGSPEIREEANCDPKQLENISEQILRKCGGVPLAIVLIAGILSRRERTESTDHAWKGVLESIGGEGDECLKIFALSYKDLPTKLKPCFLYFGLFPEDYEIDAFDIIMMWEAEGFIRGSGEQEAEVVGEDYLNHLIARNLIRVGRRRFDGRIKSIRIHDILHSLCVRVASETNFFNTPNDMLTGNSSMRVRRLTSHRSNLGDSTSFDNFRTTKLRAALCFGTDNWMKLKMKHFKNYLRESRFLRVFSLDCEWLPHAALPSEIGNLGHLSYVRLGAKFHKCLRLPTTISNLGNLVTLDLRGYLNVSIPYSIWRMKQLRHILLYEHSVVELNSDFEGGLLGNMGKVLLHSTEAVNLQTLYCMSFFATHDNYSFPKFTNLRKLGLGCLSMSDSGMSKAKGLLDSIMEPHKLRILKLCWQNGPNHDLYNIMDLNLHRYENLLRLHLDGPVMKLGECDHHQLPPNLTKLTLVWTKLKEDPMETLKKLPKLKILKFGEESYIGKKMMVCSGGGPNNNFPRLQVLEIKELILLKELIVEEGAMPQLGKLRIVRCLRCLVTRVPSRIREITEVEGPNFFLHSDLETEGEITEDEASEHEISSGEVSEDEERPMAGPSLLSNIGEVASAHQVTPS